jgi:formylglycine-generating enzyme required for sulfatase activity
VQASRSTEGRAAPGAPVPAKCPRCAAPVAGDYKFCPVCAYRLRIDPGDPLPRPPASPWKRGFLVASGLAVVFACATVGVLLYQPDWLPRRGPPAQTPTTWTRSKSYANPAIGVDDIPGLLKPLKADEVVRYHKYFALSADDRERLNDAFDPVGRQAETLFKGELIPVRIDYALQATAYEITNHQYAQFIRDVEANADRIPEYWRQDATTIQDFSVLGHVPRGWLTSEGGAEPTGWALPDDARNYPVADISFVDAMGFAQWASARFSLQGRSSLRLPALDEWTRAARGRAVERAVESGEPREWPWGTTQLIYACNNSTFWQKGVGRPEYVHFEYTEGGLGATNEGLLAMAGNVAELAVDHDLELVLGPTVERTYMRWRYKTLEVQSDGTPVPPKIWAFECGGSFRKGIDDCQVTSSSPIGVRARRDDVGFRLFSSAPEK